MVGRPLRVSEGLHSLRWLLAILKGLTSPSPLLSSYIGSQNNVKLNLVLGFRENPATIAAMTAAAASSSSSVVFQHARPCPIWRWSSSVLGLMLWNAVGASCPEMVYSSHRGVASVQYSTCVESKESRPYAKTKLRLAHEAPHFLRRTAIINETVDSGSAAFLLVELC